MIADTIRHVVTITDTIKDTIIAFDTVKYVKASLETDSPVFTLGNSGLLGDAIGGIVGTIITIPTLYYVYKTYKQSNKQRKLDQIHKMIDHLVTEMHETEILEYKGKVAYSEILQQWKNITSVLYSFLKQTEAIDSKTYSSIGYLLIYYGFNTGANQNILKHLKGVNNDKVNECIIKTIRHFNDTYKGEEQIRGKALFYYIRQNGCKTQLSSFFRQIFAIYKMIDNSDLDNKYELGKLVRNQMTVQQQGLISVNLCTPFGVQWHRLSLVRKYNPIKNIEDTTFSCINDKPEVIFALDNINFEYQNMA